MNLLPKANSWRKTILLYRFLRYRKGFGVHSPFAFSFITKVVDERCKYYAYYDIELLRRQLMHSRCPVVKSDIKKSHGQLLFRIVNYFKPQKLIQVGASAGIGTLYMIGCSSQLDYTVLGRSDESLKWTLWGLKKIHPKEKTGRLVAGDYQQNLTKALKQAGTIDLLFLNVPEEKEKNWVYIDEALRHIHADSIFFIEGIRANKEMRKVWEDMCQRDEVAVTFDLYNVGIAFFNKRLYKQNYIVFF